MIDFRKTFTVVKLSDRFRFWATTFVSLWLVSPAAFAGLDFSVSGAARSFPLSGVIEAESGYGVTVWGTSGGDSPFYGYVRPRAIFGSAYTYNSLDGALEVFPVSFFGVRGGLEGIQNDSDYSDHDCDTYECKGRYYRAYLETELTLGAGPVFMQAAWRPQHWSRKEGENGTFIDPTSGIALAGDGEKETVYRGILGFKFSDKWQAVAALRYSESDKTRSFSRFPYAAVRWKQGDFSVGAGAGVFESTLKKPTGSGVLFIRWEPRPSVALH